MRAAPGEVGLDVEDAQYLAAAPRRRGLAADDKGVVREEVGAELVQAQRLLERPRPALGRRQGRRTGEKGKKDGGSEVSCVVAGGWGEAGMHSQKAHLLDLVVEEPPSGLVLTVDTHENMLV